MKCRGKNWVAWGRSSGALVLLALGALGLGLQSSSVFGGSQTVTELLADTGTYDNTSTALIEATGNPVPLAQFETAVLNAYNLNLGGVITFNDARGSESPGLGLDPGGTSGRAGNYITGVTPVPYGVSQTSQITISPIGLGITGSYGLWDVWQDWRYTLGTAISHYFTNLNGTANTSGGAFLTPGTSSSNTHESIMTFSAPGSSPVSNLGLTLLGVGGSPQTVVITANFSGGGTDTRTQSIAGSAAGDTFFDFAAPSGQSVTSFTWSSTIGRPAIDNVAFYSAAGYTYFNGASVSGPNLSYAANWSGGVPAAGTEIDFGPRTGTQNYPYNDLPNTNTYAGIRYLGASDASNFGGTGASSAYTLTGNLLTLTGPINNDGTNDQVIDIGLQLSGNSAGTINTVTNNITFNGPISSVDSTSVVTKTGSATAVFAGTNTYTGNTIISAGALEADATVGLPTTTNLALNGGVLQNHGQMTLFNWPLGTGAGAVQWTSSGGFSAHNAALAVNIGGSSATLQWGQTTNFIANGSALLFGSNTSNNVVTFQNPIDLYCATGPQTVQVTAGAGGDYTVFSGVVSDSQANASGGLVKTGNGTLILTATNTYAGPTTIDAGALGADDGVGLPGTNLVLNGGVFQGNGAPNFTRPLGLGAGAVQWTSSGGFAARNGELTVNIGGATPPTALTWGATGNFVASGTALLFGSNTSNNEVNFRNPIDLNNAVQTVQVANGYSPTGGWAGDYALLSGVISDIAGHGYGGLTKSGPGLLKLSGVNTYSGTTTITGGALQADEGTGLPTATNLTLSGGVYQSNSLTSFTRSLGTGPDQVQWTSPSGGFAAAQNPLSVLINHNVSPVLVWASTPNFIPTNGILLFGSPSANATVNFENYINLNGVAGYVNVTAGTAGAVGDAATLSGVISDTTGGGGLVKTGNGMLILTGPNTYGSSSGFTDINGGILNVGIADTNTTSIVGTGPMGGVLLNAANTISFGGGTLQYSSVNQTDYSGRFTPSTALVPQPISIDTNGQSVTFASAITGVGGSLTENDTNGTPGKLTLTGPNTYTGITTINGGVLSLGIVDNNTAGSTGTGPLGSVELSAANTIVFGGGTLQYSSVNNTDYSGRFSTAANQPISIDTNGQSVTFATALTSPGGSLTVNDTNGTPGMLVLAAAETYTGGTTIKGGEIKLNGLLGSLPTGGDLTMTAGTFDLEGTSQSVGNLKGGATALITDNQTGVGGPGSNGTTLLTVNFPSGEDTYAGKIADGATAYVGLTKNGAGTLILSSADDYSGGTLINSGVLVEMARNVIDTSGAPAGPGSLTVGSLVIEPGAKFIYNPTFSGSPMASPAGSPETVPEPSTLVLLAAGAAALVAWRRRRG